jgi:hypothetical protein
VVKLYKFTTLRIIMKTDNLKELLWEYLPKDLNLERYELEKIDKDDDLEKYHPFLWYRWIYLVEENIKPKWYENNKNIISKWFYEYKTLMEIPIRFKVWRIFIKKRKWYNTQNKKVITTDDIEYKWSKTIEDLLFFCKELITRERSE